MIIPSTRLLYLFALIVLPFAIIGTIFSAEIELSSGIIVLFVLIVAIDAFLSHRRFDGITFEFPDIVRLSKDKKGNIEFRIKNDKASKSNICIGLAFPDQLVPDNEELFIELPAGNDLSMFSWPCTGLTRGNYKFEKCYCEAASYLGLWSFRTSSAINMEVRIYPNLIQERKSLAAIFLNRGMCGIHAQRQIGQGREFEKLREYVYGDSYDQLHWKATARRGRPITKVFQIEKTQEVYVIVDASRLSVRGAKDLSGNEQASTGCDHETILERFINTALIMGLVAERQGDIFGLLSFDNRVRNFIKAKNGKAHFSICRDSLYSLQPQTVNPDFDDLFTFISQRIRRRSLLIFLTNLDDPVLAESFMKNIDLIARKHLILVNMLKPAGVQRLFSRPNIESIDDIYRDLGGNIALHSLLEIQKVLRQRGVNFSILDNEKFCAEIVSQYIAVKQRQLI
jgi:uncharacterized protein (DUF58 family)